jgi:hypothetical protein
MKAVPTLVASFLHSHVVNHAKDRNSQCQTVTPPFQRKESQAEEMKYLDVLAGNGVEEAALLLEDTTVLLKEILALHAVLQNIKTNILSESAVGDFKSPLFVKVEAQAGKSSFVWMGL